MKASASKQAPTATDSQEKPTHKPVLSIAPQKEEPRKGSVQELVEILEWVSLYDPEIPLSSSEVSKLYNAAKNYVQLARAIGDSTPEVVAECFATRLADLQACVAASKSGKFNLPPREMKRCAGVFAVKLFQEVRVTAENWIEEGQAALENAV